ncbi:predicted protein [Nematostella vectensis]|uniref:BAH domain-containing protein n=1 Tax=Nematostella vectensis TaxID=45351 RepID=A7STK2_NEMVE|nr:predicted protein [Nematostella vectensis]|eukprot:XP_001625059.1 predicted protein [Nematostella vectensis]
MPVSTEKATHGQEEKEFEWIGKGISEDGYVYFKKCSIKGTVITTGCYVLINSSADCMVGKLEALYDRGPYPDRHRAEIHWLFQYDELTPDVKLKLKAVEGELFLPCNRPDQKPIYGSVENLDAETIIEEATVKFIGVKEEIPDNNEKKIGRVFFVRYGFDRNGGIYQAKDMVKMLEDVTQQDMNNNKAITPASSKTPIARAYKEKAWRVGTPRMRRKSNGAFELDELKVVLKVIDKHKLGAAPATKTRQKQEQNKENGETPRQEVPANRLIKTPLSRRESTKPTEKTGSQTPGNRNTRQLVSKSDKGQTIRNTSKRKASKSIPEESTVVSKKSKAKGQQSAKSDQRTRQKKGKTEIKSPRQRFGTTEVLEILLSDEPNSSHDDYYDKDESFKVQDADSDNDDDDNEMEDDEDEEEELADDDDDDDVSPQAKKKCQEPHIQ